MLSENSKQSPVLGIFIAFLLVFIAFLLFRDCGRSVTSKPADTKEVRKKEIEVSKEQIKAEAIKDTVIKWHDRWRAAKKQDTLRVLINTCDSVIVHDSVLIYVQEDIITKKDTIISMWHDIHEKDSTALIGANKENRKLKRRLFFWKFITAVSIAGNAAQSVH